MFRLRTHKAFNQGIKERVSYNDLNIATKVQLTRVVLISSP